MDDPTDNYKVTSLGEQKMPKFSTTANRYRVNFQNLEISSLSNILQSLRRLFSSLINDLTGIGNFKTLFTSMDIALINFIYNKNIFWSNHLLFRCHIKSSFI